MLSILFLFIAIQCTYKPVNTTDPDFVPFARNALPATEGSKTMTVMSWNVKHLGRELFNSAQASPLLADADIVTFQEVNASETGLHALTNIARHLSDLTHERICIGLSQIPSDDRERYAYIWRNSRVAYVKTDGEIVYDCPNSAITIRLGVRNAAKIVREPALGTFYFKPAAKQFVLASIHLIPTAKKPKNEVEPLFDTFRSVQHPLIVAGDYNLGPSHRVFKGVMGLGFQGALAPGMKTSLRRKQRTLSKAYDNFWFRNIQLAGPPRVLNLYDIFTEKNRRDIYDNFSDHCPIIAQFHFLP
ncbi:MAG: endonuclease/exonuclease/phosphatase family protein [Bdellovibrionales bacterium]